MATIKSINYKKILMKKLILTLIFLSFCTLITAQEKNTIKVSSRVIYIDPDPTFKADVALSGTHLLKHNNKIELDSIKQDFKNKIEENQLSWANVKEYPGTFGFETMGYNSLGVIYQYETKSASDMKRFLNIRLPTLTRLDMRSTIEIDLQEAKKITQMAYDKSLKQATLLARTMKRQVGAITAVEENGGLLSKPYEVGLYYNRPPGEYYYDIEVTYELK